MQHIFVVSFLLMCSFSIRGQNPWIDSVKNALRAQTADTSRLNALLHLSAAFQFSKPDSGLYYGQQALRLAEQLGSDSSMFWSIVSISGSLYVLGNYTRQLDYAIRAIPLAEKLNTPYSLGISNGMLSDSYYNLGEYDSSMKIWRRVIRIAEAASLTDIYRVHGNTSRIFTAMKQYDSALYYAKLSYALVCHDTSLSDYDARRLKALLFHEFGNAFEGKGDHDSALLYFRKSLPYAHYTSIDAERIDIYNSMAITFQSVGALDSAIWYAERVQKESVSKNHPFAQLKSANLLASVYEAKHLPDSSLKYLHLSLGLKDSLFNREKTVAFQAMLFKEAEKRRAVESARRDVQWTYMTYLISTFFIVAIVVATIAARNRRLKQWQAIRNGIADDLHDDIGSTLSSISIMNELAKTQSPQSLALLTAIGENTAAIQENMSDIVWAIKAENDRFENILSRMNLFASSILDSKNITLEFSSDASLSTLILKMEQRKSFYLFFKEAINNAAKHSEAKHVYVNIHKRNEEIELNIIDNGRGFDTGKVSNGNGMNSLKKRVTELRAKFTLTSTISQGTTVQLRFPISQYTSTRRTSLS